MISRWGKIRNIDLDNRIFEIETKHKLEYYYFGRSQYKRFKPYLHEGLYVYFFCKDELVKSKVRRRNGEQTLYQIS